MSAIENLLSTVRGALRSPRETRNLRNGMATMQDVEQCYRLLLGRSPDRSGLEYYMRQIGGLTLEDLVRRFMNSSEFRRRPLVLETVGREDNAATLMECDKFSISLPLHNQDIGRAIRKAGVYEPHVSAVFEEIIAPGMTIVDVGANLGWFSLLSAALLNGEGKVHAIEANFRNCTLLQRSVAANGFDDVVTIHPVAASDSTTTLLLQPQAGSNGLVSDDMAASWQLGTHPVQAVRLDELLRDVERLDLFKIDIEGSEYRALVGMRSLLQQFTPPVLMEYSPDLLEIVSHCSPIKLLNLCAELGYCRAQILAEHGERRDVPLDQAVLEESFAEAAGDHLDLLLTA